MAGGVGPGLNQGGHVGGGSLMAVGLGLDAGQPLGGLAAVVPLAAQDGAALLLSRGVLLGGGDLDGEGGRGRPRGRDGPVFGRGLLLDGTQPLQPAGRGDVLPGGRAQSGGGGPRAGRGKPGAGLLLGVAGLGQGGGGPVGFLERRGHLGAALGRGEFLPEFGDRRGVLRELVAGAQRIGPAALAVGQALRVTLAVLGCGELGTAGVDLGLAGRGGEGGGLGQPRSPGGIGQRVQGLVIV